MERITKMDWFSDRSHYETGQRCPRSRYWNYHYNQRGVVPVGGGADLLFGSAIHKMLEDPKLDPPLDDLHSAIAEILTPDGFSSFDEWLALYQGLAETFRRFMLPQILTEYDWIAHELEMTMDLAGVRWMSRLDGVLRRKSDGLYFVLEAKTSSYLQALQNVAATNFQLLMECEALRRELENDWTSKQNPDAIPAGVQPQIGGALLLVFDKGERRRATKAEQDRGVDGYRRISPFTYWYGKSQADGSYSYRLDWAKGYDRIPTWTVPDWYETAVENWPDQVQAQVQLWPSVGFDWDRTKSVIRQIEELEGRLKPFREAVVQYPEMLETLVDRYFPQNFSQCENYGGFRRACQYKSCCFSPQVGRDPLASGEFVAREFNHPQEGQ